MNGPRVDAASIANAGSAGGASTTPVGIGSLARNTLTAAITRSSSATIPVSPEPAEDARRRGRIVYPSEGVRGVGDELVRHLGRLQQIVHHAGGDSAVRHAVVFGGLVVSGLSPRRLRP
jgi:hypothetical protein